MPRPNILILYTDQQRADALGAAGNLGIHTPHLDRLARSGALFRQCHVQNPLCMPSRASFLTGRYPSALGITHMGVPVPEDTVTIATLFGRAGYHCANLGKLHFLPHANRDHTRVHPPYGFHHLEIADEPGVYEDAYRAWVRRIDPAQLPHLSTGLPPARKQWLDAMGETDSVPHPVFQNGAGGRDDFAGAIPFSGDEAFTHTAFVAQRTIEHLESRAGAAEPFLCIAGFYSPHAPWRVPTRFLELYDPAKVPILPLEKRGGVEESRMRSIVQGYYAMVSEVDEWCGRILETLERTGQAENTIVVFTADHGEWLGEGGKFGKGYPGDDAVTRVPLIMRAPGWTSADGQHCDALVEAVDVLPTLLDFAGLPVPSDLQGRSLGGYLRGEAVAERESALTEFAGWRSLRTAEYRYLVHADGRECLYHLAPGADSKRDVAAEPAHATARADHCRMALARLLQAEQPKRRVWPY